MSVDHVLLTRFNLPSAGREGVIRAQEGWLRERVELFLRYTVPTVAAQTAPVSWVVYFDPASPEWLRARLAPLVEAGAFVPVYAEAVTSAQVADDARRASGGRGRMLLTTNLDNDDAIAIDFAERLQRLVVPGERRALYLGNGLIRQGPRVYLRRDRHNAFVSVAEGWHAPRTAWCDWHTLVPRHMPTVSTGGAPGWIQVVHARNVSNRVRGRLADPARHRALFPGMLDDLDAARRADVLADALVRRPLRESRELARGAVKGAVMAAVGRDGLDRLKDRVLR
ncbi:putative rhamnosyl transferase [Microbacterium sp. Marseille-Q6965]|uniref:putative rhamnosyl transferase n=1 Tax=Microbacterium sp. Marseille-Q6965 TaxID=2965072 RepID=UPI0021B79839|nr:putative rhamnosyl transferase [Microbacterium sp. Marseille-Q6965]